jgi:hypothetical protein
MGELIKAPEPQIRDKALVIICGYGLVTESLRGKSDYENTIKYFDQVWSTILMPICASNSHTYAVLTGGATRLDDRTLERYEFGIPLSESKTLLGYFDTHKRPSSHFGNGTRLSLLLETISQDSVGNVFYGLLAAIRILPEVTKVIIVCDNVRKSKLQSIAEILFNGFKEPNETAVRFDWEIQSLEREDTHSDSTPEAQTKAIEEAEVYAKVLKPFLDNIVSQIQT